MAKENTSVQDKAVLTKPQAKIGQAISEALHNLLGMFRKNFVCEKGKPDMEPA